jgi:hypothetical protein
MSAGAGAGCVLLKQSDNRRKTVRERVHET